MRLASHDLHLPGRRLTSVVFASPHSGQDYPEDFLARSVLDARQIRSSEDAFVDQLFAAAPRFGAPLVTARAPRAWLDLNRSAEELDPALIEGVGKLSHNPRVASGLGVIPRVVAGGRAIYAGKITRAEAQRRIQDCWEPYHATLQGLMQQSLEQFGEAILIDCHSMPHEALDGMVRAGVRRPDIVLGDRFGASASGQVVDRIQAAFESVGLKVVRNAPFAGAFVVQTYGRPSRNQHAIQVEIDRALYMDEGAIAPGPQFEEFRAMMCSVTAELAAIGARDLPLAAE